MSAHISHPAAPSLLGSVGPARTTGSHPECTSAGDARDLLDLMYDGFHMIFLLRNGHAPTSAEVFFERICRFLLDVELGAQRLRSSAQDVFLSKFAYCALVDEVVLASTLNVRDDWERRPMQLQLFGEQLAGERFFEHLETLREEGAKRVEALEVFHMCLLLGFQGRYALEGAEKLGFLTARVGDEIAQLRGSRARFAPHWEAPDQVAHTLRSELPLWVVGSLFAMLVASAYLGLRTVLHGQTLNDLRSTSNVIKLAPQTAHVSITLP